jgi:hypothetical protein
MEFYDVKNKQKVQVDPKRATAKKNKDQRALETLMNTEFASVIRNIQRELITSQEQREEEGLPPLFKVSGLTLELQFTLEEDKSAEGKLGISIVQAGAAKKVSENTVHKMVIQFSVVDDHEMIVSKGRDDYRSGKLPHVGTLPNVGPY